MSDSGIIARIAEYMTMHGYTASSLSKEINIDPSNMSKMLKGEQKITDKTISKIVNALGLNRMWLLTGEGEMYIPQDGKINERNVKYMKLSTTKDGYETYLLPQSAMGGSLSGFAEDGVTLQHCEKVISPIKGIDFAISVYGESMAPEYPSGSRVLIKKINPTIFIDWGKVYVLDTSNGVVIKELHKNSKDGYITCHSVNPDPKYSDFEIPISEIYGFYIVLMCLSAK